MKIKGKILQNANIEVVVLPRVDGDIVFKFKPVLNYDEFEELCPKPPVPTSKRAGGESFKNPDDPDYRIALAKYSTLRYQWSFIESISATEDLEWSKIVRTDPSTWHLIDQEIDDAQILPAEKSMMIDAYNIANALDENKLQIARESFLAGVQTVP